VRNLLLCAAFFLAQRKSRSLAKASRDDNAGDWREVKLLNPSIGGHFKAKMLQNAR
jgi:hypothetical protein